MSDSDRNRKPPTNLEEMIETAMSFAQFAEDERLTERGAAEHLELACPDWQPTMRENILTLASSYNEKRREVLIEYARIQDDCIQNLIKGCEQVFENPLTSSDTNADVKRRWIN